MGDPSVTRFTFVVDSKTDTSIVSRIAVTEDETLVRRWSIVGTAPFEIDCPRGAAAWEASDDL